VLGGIAAKLGYLRLPWVIVSAFVGTLMSDQLFFFLGRRQGQAFLLKHPHWNSRAQNVHRMLERHRIPIIIGFHFVYGFRTVTPFVLGMSRVPVIEFIVLYSRRRRMGLGHSRPRIRLRQLNGIAIRRHPPL